MSQKVLVTGADGFIGSHLVEKLVREGYSVKAFVYYNSFNSWGWLDDIDKEVQDQIEVVTGDVRDYHCLKHAAQTCDVIMHLAALIAIPYSYYSPQSYIDTNVTGTLNVVQAAQELEIEKVITTSTSEVYGTAQFVPITEEHPLVGQSPSSASKIAADQIAYSYYCSFKTPVTIVRPFNTYGPRQSARAVIPTIITQIANGYEKIELGALTPTRDFNFVEDTVDGFISVLKSDKGAGEVINIGSNYEVSIGDTAETIARLMQKDVNIILDPKRMRPKNSEVERLYSSNSKAKEVLNWSPRYPGREGLEKGLKKTIDWFVQKENLAKYKSGVYNI